MKKNHADELPSWMDTLDVSSKHTHQKLLLRVKNPDDKEAWDIFFPRYCPLINDMASAYARRHGLRLSETDIEEVAMEVMVQVSNAMGDFVYKPGEGAFRRYLATIAYRQCINLRRKKDVRKWDDVAQYDQNKEKPKKPGVFTRDDERRDEEENGKRCADNDEDAVDAHERMMKESNRRANADRLQEIIYSEIVADRTGEISKLIEKHDQEIGRKLALEKLRASGGVTARQFQIFEKLAMGVEPADVCAQLNVTINQIFNARALAKPHYKRALLAAKEELDKPQSLPPPLNA